MLQQALGEMQYTIHMLFWSMANHLTCVTMAYFGMNIIMHTGLVMWYSVVRAGSNNNAGPAKSLAQES